MQKPATTKTFNPARTEPRHPHTDAESGAEYPRSSDFDQFSEDRNPLIPTPSSSRTTSQIPLPTGATRGMFHTHVYWQASNIQHNPLYFEDAMLERLTGTNAVSLATNMPQSMTNHHSATIPLLPYHETLRPKHDCVYALGHYRRKQCTLPARQHPLR